MTPQGPDPSLIEPPSPGAAPHQALPQTWREVGIVALMLAAPGTLIPGFLWVQWQAMVLHSDRIGVWHPTLSWSLNNPAISGPFGALIVASTPLLMGAVLLCVRYFWAYTASLGKSPAGVLFWRAFVAGAGVLQVVAAVGMLMVISFPSHTHSAPHLMGSYILFAGHAGSILMSGVYSRLLGRPDGPLPDPAWRARERRRWRWALAVFASALLYLGMFLAPKLSSAFDFYGFSALAAGTEVLVLSVFLTYLFGFTPELLRFDRHQRAGRP